MALVTVQVRLGVKTGKIDRNAPFMVWGEAGPHHHPSICVDAPDVIAQIAEGEHQARFMAEWDGERCKRVCTENLIRID